MFAFRFYDESHLTPIDPLNHDQKNNNNNRLHFQGDATPHGLGSSFLNGVNPVQQAFVKQPISENQPGKSN